MLVIRYTSVTEMELDDCVSIRTYSIRMSTDEAPIEVFETVTLETLICCPRYVWRPWRMRSSVDEARSDRFGANSKLRSPPPKSGRQTRSPGVVKMNCRIISATWASYVDCWACPNIPLILNGNLKSKRGGTLTATPLSSAFFESLQCPVELDPPPNRDQHSMK